MTRSTYYFKKILIKNKPSSHELLEHILRAFLKEVESILTSQLMNINR